MNTQRAKEIVASPDMIDVTHNGERIYIQHVNEKEGTARIYPLGQTENERTVPLNSLREQ